LSTREKPEERESNNNGSNNHRGTGGWNQPENPARVEIICELHGIKPSTYVRQLIVRDLIKEGIFERPTFQRFDNSIPQTAAE